MKKVNLFLVLFIYFVYMETLYRLLVFNNIFIPTIVNVLLFIVPLSLFLYVLSKISKSERLNKRIFITFLLFITIWFSVQYVVKSYFGIYVSFSTLKIADQVGDFLTKALVEIIRRIPGITLFFLPVVLVGVFSKYINFRHIDYKMSIFVISLVAFTFNIYIIGLNINKDKLYSPYFLYYKVNDIALNIENLGVMSSFYLDVQRNIFGFNYELVDVDDPLLEDNEEKIKVYDYNKLDIDFKNLMINEKNSKIKEMHEYFMDEEGTMQNEYTGFFKDKNLILFMAESFNEIAVSKELTPTLYKLVNSGFVFENFYSPAIYSTIGGEFQELTGLYPTDGAVLKKFRSGSVSFPLGIANVFKDINYKTYAYHDNSYTFQNRNRYLKSLGFDSFKACGNGLEKNINCHEWPQSDVRMIEETINDYINEDKFMVFYATVSGHSPYDSLNANASSRKHKEEYEQAGFTYSKRVASYLAAQMELDRALDTLIKELDKAGRLDDTVISLVGDHYPYELTLDEVNEVSSYKRDGVVSVNKSNFILWNNKMDTVKIDKVGSQIDVIPTLYNLFNISYDSRLFIGRDILSDGGGLAIFDNKSWVTDKGTYYTSGHKFVPRSGVDVDDNYVKQVNQLVLNRINMSKNIIENNYYAKVFN